MADKRDRKRYNHKYPCHVDVSLPIAEWRKLRTLELYDYLPQTTLEERYTYTDIRDEVISLNEGFFVYVAQNAYLKERYITFEDKLQSVRMNFLKMWHKFGFGEKYRTDLAFSVFFKPRLNECVWRDLCSVKYSTDRTLKMEAAEQLGIYYKDLKYEDLAKVNLPPDKMSALQAIFKTGSEMDLDTASIYVPDEHVVGFEDDSIYDGKYNDLDTMLMGEMVKKERKLTVDDLIEVSHTFTIPLQDLMDALPDAESELYNKLSDDIFIQSNFH